MKKRVISFLLLFILTLNHISLTADASSVFCYINDEKHFITKRNVTYQGNSLNFSSAPALAIDGVNYLPAEKMIAAISDLSGSYDASNKKISLTFKTNTIVMTAESTSATLNDKSITISQTPVLVKFSTSGEETLYIPAKQTAEKLGMGYEYSNSGKKIILTSENETIVDDSFKPTITLARPSGVAKGTITWSDDYHNKQFVITMKGNYTSFYSSNKPVLPSGVTFSSSYSSSTGKTSLVFKTSSINGWKLKEDSSKIYLMNGTPSSMFKNVIVLDPGHGGSDPGACYGTTYKEADFTLKIVLAAIEKFNQNSDFKVYSTRLSNELPSGISRVWDRRTFANNLKADIFVSVHINSYNSVSTGTETLYNSSHNVKNSGGLSCSKLASIVQSHVQKATGFKDRGTKVDSSLSVLNSNNNPAVLTEIGFISNYSEAKTMAANLDKYGAAIYNAIVDASTQYPTGR